MVLNASVNVSREFETLTGLIRNLLDFVEQLMLRVLDGNLKKVH